jgi:alpha-1,3-rhamnosyl/mannosyltransferase
LKAILSVDAVRFPLTGIGRYVYELARHLPQVDPALDLRLFAQARFIDRLPDESASALGAAPAQGVGWRLRNALQASPLVVRAHRALFARRQARALSGHEDAVYHGPQFYLPDFDGPSVATLHDLSVFSWAHCHPRGRAASIQREILRAIARARLLIADSEFTRREIAQHFGLSEQRIRAVPLAAGEEFHPREPAALAVTLQRHGLAPGAYCLFAGTIEPRKNIETLIDAYGRLDAGLRARYPLVLAGYRGWRSDAIHARIERAAAEGWVRYLGYLPSADLPLLFAGARLFAFPSLYEGFGLPVLEAMASGVPVVCSTSSSLPEVAGEAAATCEPLDVSALTGLLERGLSDDGWRNAAREAGLANAARFSWRRCAEQTLAVYREAAA